MKFAKFFALAVAAVIVMSASSAEAGLLAKLCGKSSSCEPTTCCEPAPVSCGCEEVVVEDCGCAAPEPCGCEPVCEPACDPCDPCCEKPGLFARLKAKMAARRAARCCPAPSCGC